jgi:glycosyltransferase involved in cell wall biosynthesis
MDRTEETESQTEKIIRENVDRAKKYADVLIAGGDLVHFGQKGIMLPLATDLSLWKLSPPNNHQTLVIVHSTNHRSHKGTRFIIEIVEKLAQKIEILRRQGRRAEKKMRPLKNLTAIKLLLIENKTIEECRKIYPQADIFITDVITGWHGFTAIEAMAIGRPVIAYLRPDIAQHHAYYAKGRIPIVSANPDTLARAITKLVKDRKWREELGQKGRQYALKFHSFEFVGALRRIIYEYIWTNQKINQKIFEREVKRRKLI